MSRSNVVPAGGSERWKFVYFQNNCFSGMLPAVAKQSLFACLDLSAFKIAGNSSSVLMHYLSFGEKTRVFHNATYSGKHALSWGTIRAVPRKKAVFSTARDRKTATAISPLKNSRWSGDLPSSGKTPMFACLNC
jgi:hypothetical protein